MESILKLYNIDNKILSKYESQAFENFDSNFFAHSNIYLTLKDANLPKEINDKIANFIPLIDENLQKYLWLLYYTLYKSDFDYTFLIHSIIYVTIEPKFIEENHKGFLKLVLYLMGSRNLLEFVKNNNLPLSIYEKYFNRFLFFIEKNIISYNTIGIIKSEGFLYAYSKPCILYINNLTFQITNYHSYNEVYVNDKKERVFVALPNFKYDSNGLQDEQSNFVPTYEIKDNILTCNVFKSDGTLDLNETKLNLSEYKRLLAPGDKVITIHIPKNTDLSLEKVKESIKYAQKIIESLYTDIKAIVCHTWFIAYQVRHLLKAGGNMVKFTTLFDVITAGDNKNHSIYDHIFEKPKDIPLEQLVPINNFQKVFLDRALKGEKLYWAYGLLKENALS